MSARRACMPDSTALAVTWQKAAASNPSGECVELGALSDGVTIAMRNSRDPRGPALLFDAEAVCSLIDAAKDDELDWVLDYSRYKQHPGGGIFIRGGSGETGPGA